MFRRLYTGLVVAMFGCGERGGDGPGLPDVRGDGGQCEARDTDCDGRITSVDGVPCPRCVAVCSGVSATCVDAATHEPLGRWYVLSCSLSETLTDHGGISIDCGSGSPRCERYLGDPLPGDLSQPRCRVAP